METTYNSFAPISSFHLGLPQSEFSVNPENEVKQRNIEALLGIFEDDLLNGGKFYKQLLKYAIDRTGNFQHAEDAVANFYCNTVRKVKKGVLSFEYPVNREKGIDGNPRVKPWAFTCISNSCADSYRRRNGRLAKRLYSALDVSDLDLPGKPEECDSRTLRDEIKEVVQKGLSELPEDSREIIELIYFQGLKYREAAEKIGIPISTAKSRMHSALKNLRKIHPIRELRDVA